MPILGREPGTHVYRDLDEHPEDETDPSVVAIRIDGGLFFATAEALDERIRALAEDDPDIHTLVLDLEGVDLIDSQGAAKVSEIEELARARGVSLRLARVKPGVRGVLEAEGVIGRLGSDHVHGNIFRAVDTALAERTLVPPNSGPPTTQA